MYDDLIGKILPPPWKGTLREREQSGVQPFFSMSVRRRGRSISRVVLARTRARDQAAPLEPDAEPDLELFFGLG